MRTLTVELGARSYPVHIGAGLRARGDLFAAAIRGRQVMVVSNEVVAPLYLDDVLGALADLETRQVVLPDGEAYKTLAQVEAVVTALLEARFDRGCTVLALGGGVTGDIAGFAAACYQRGVDFVQVPTTLLAQVDSAVGGKTGVNHPLGKNMIGAFHQPRCVIADTSVLDTLADRELGAGLAEVIKYGLIRDPELLRWLEETVEALRAREPAALEHAIEQACRNKAEVVAADERESGQRALLNLGHSFAHAIEAGLGYGRWLHGEAVAAGIVLAADLSQRLGWLEGAHVERIEALLCRAGLPLRRPRELPAERMLELMSRDKKTRDGRLRLVLLRGLGHAVVSDEYDPALLTQTLHGRCEPSEVA